MRVIGGISYLEMAELEAARIPYDTVKKARRRGSAGVTVIDDPADRRRILVKYDDLKPTWKAKVDAVHGGSVVKGKRGLWVTLLVVTATDLAALRSYVLPDGTSLSEQQVNAYARACAYLRLFHTATRAQVNEWGYTSMREWCDDAIAQATEEGTPLPSSYGRVMARVREYHETGTLCMVSRRYGNQGARKIGPDQSAWLVSMYAQPNKPDTHKVWTAYTQEALVRNWPALTESAITKHLMRPDLRPLWTLGRHGKEVYRNQYRHTLSTRNASCRDAMWCSDGTKLNYFYQGEGGMMAKMQVYLVMDVYSEAILGHAFGTSENSQVQYMANKMAVQTAGQLPYQWLYDGQSGHTKRDSQDFFNRASRIHFKGMKDNPQGKPVEGLIGRLQREVMRDRWFFTGGNVQTSNLNTQANMEFVMANKHRLPSLEEVMRFAEEDVENWNNRPHPRTQLARIDMYRASVNPHAQPVDFLDMVELFWLITQRPITYRKGGLTMELAGQRLQYEVYGPDGMPDLNFLHRWTNAAFTVKYDPDDLSAVRLYRIDEKAELRFVAQAETKRLYARAVMDLQPGERSEIDSVLAVRKAQERMVAERLQAMREQSGIDPETLLTIGHRGGDKDLLNAAEEAYKAQPAAPVPVPVLSNGQPAEDDDDTIDLWERL